MKRLSRASTLLALSAFGLCAQPYNLVFVGSNGADAATCGLGTTPCATFRQATVNVAVGGEIDALDAGDYGDVYLPQAVTIDGGGVARISTMSGVGCSGVIVAAICAGSSYYSGAIVIRNLSINLADYPNNYTGVHTGGTLDIYLENVQVTGAKNFCLVNNNAALVIRDSNFRNCGVSGIYSVGLAPVTIDNVGISNSLIGINVATGTGLLYPPGVFASVAVRNSNISQNVTGVSVISDGPAPAVVTLDSTMVYKNGTGISSITGGVLQMSNVTVTGNGAGLVANTGGSIISFVNNRIYNNTTNGAPTSSVYMK